MSDPVSYLQEMDAMACQACDTRRRLEAEVAELRKRRDELLTSNNEFEQRYRDAKAKAATLRTQLQASEALVEQCQMALRQVKLRIAFIGMPSEPMRYSGKGRWVPDWRMTIEKMESALALAPAAALSGYRDVVLEEVAKWAENLAKMDGDCTLSPAEIRAMKEAK
jgi:seryl-tRNA synthetase